MMMILSKDLRVGDMLRLNGGDMEFVLITRVKNPPFCPGTTKEILEIGFIHAASHEPESLYLYNITTELREIIRHPRLCK